MTRKYKYNEKKIIILILCAIAFSSCTNSRSSDKENNEASEDEVAWIDKSAYLEKDQGWVYMLIISFEDKKDTKIFNYTIDGFNMKNKSLSKFSEVPLLGEDGSILDVMDSSIPTISGSGSEEEAELLGIFHYLTEKRYERKVTLEDFADYSFSIISKEEMVDMYNRAFLQDNREFGEFGNIPYVNCIQMTSEVGEIFQLSYIVNYGYIEEVNIEFFDKYGNSLVSKMEQGIANVDEVNVQKKLDVLEDEIIAKNTYKLKFKFNYVDQFDEKIEELLEYSFTPIKNDN